MALSRSDPQAHVRAVLALPARVQAVRVVVAQVLLRVRLAARVQVQVHAVPMVHVAPRVMPHLRVRSTPLVIRAMRRASRQITPTQVVSILMVTARAVPAPAARVRQVVAQAHRMQASPVVDQDRAAQVADALAVDARVAAAIVAREAAASNPA